MNKVILMGRLTSDPKNGLDTFRGFQTVRHIYISSQSAVQKEWTGRYRFYLLYRMGSQTISINNDPDAPINTIADYVINGSIEEVVPKMIKYYKQNSK